MTRTLLSCAALAVLLPVGGDLAAQPGRDPNAALLRRADSLEVGAYCAVARRLVAQEPVVQALAADSSRARASAAIICNPLLTHFSLLGLTGSTAAPLAAVARSNTNAYRDAQRGILDAMAEFRAVTRAPGTRDVVRAALAGDHAGFVRLAETAHGLASLIARDSALARLERYERKLGPNSARLNGAEVLLNYAAQRWAPGFRPSPTKGPSPLEVVASYAPGWVTVDDEQPVPVSASEFGIRWYLFGERFGKTGTAGLLFPSYWSAGVITASDRNGALVWPWQGRDRSGVWVGWGSLKVAWIDRANGSVLVSKQFQAVPYLF